jgi:hypothetical protein
MERVFMKSVAFQFRLIPDATAEQEWLYLVNESYVGEQCIVPLLRELMDAPVEGAGFRRMLQRQIIEEEGHVALYADLLCSRPHESSGYDRALCAYVRALPNTTLKLFALQALLEGIGLGALRYRAAALASSPGDALDRRVQADELRHIHFARAFTKVLVAADGVIPSATFDVVARDVNAIFARHFSGAHVSDLMARAYGLDVSASSIDASPGMRRFFWKSLNSQIESKSDFLRHYHAGLGTL